MKRKAQILSALLALILVTSACGTTAPQASESAASTAATVSASAAESSSAAATAEAKLLADPGPADAPFVNGTYDLTVGLATDTNITDYETNTYTTLLEKKSGINLSFEFFPAKEAKQKLAILVASDSNLPDVVCLGLSDMEVASYGSSGAFLALNDFFDTNSYYIKKRLSEGADKMLPYITSPDGKIYTVPKYNPEYGNEWDGRFWINKTWLEKLSLKAPTTTEELFTVLKAFRDGDPNGNGKKDEFPLIGSNNGWNTKPSRFLMNSFIYFNDPCNYLIAENGKLDVAYNKTQWKAGLEFMNKLVQEELLSPLTYTQDNDQFKQILENPDIQLVGSMPAGSMSIFQTDSKRKQDMTHLAPLTGPEGISWATKRPQLFDNFGYVTKFAKDPDVAFRLLDLMWEDEISVSARFGERGVHWDWAGETEKGMGLYEGMGIPATIKIIENIWGQPQNAQWSDPAPAFRPYEYGVGGQTWDGKSIYDSQYMTAQAVPFYLNKAPKEIVLRLLFTTEENDEIAEISSSLITYVNEQMEGFIVGAIPLSDWDNYVSELDKIGLTRYLEVAQKAYDRMNGK